MIVCHHDQKIIYIKYHLTKVSIFYFINQTSTFQGKYNLIYPLNKQERHLMGEELNSTRAHRAYITLLPHTSHTYRPTNRGILSQHISGQSCNGRTGWDRIGWARIGEKLTKATYIFCSILVIILIPIRVISSNKYISCHTVEATSPICISRISPGYSWTWNNKTRKHRVGTDLHYGRLFPNMVLFYIWYWLIHLATAKI